MKKFSERVAAGIALIALVSAVSVTSANPTPPPALHTVRIPAQWVTNRSEVDPDQLLKDNNLNVVDRRGPGETPFWEFDVSDSLNLLEKEGIVQMLNKKYNSAEVVDK